MTDVNGVPILNPEAAPAMRSTTIAPVPITLEPEKNEFTIAIREPGIIRAVGWWLREPVIQMARMKGVQKIPQPVLFVEIDPDCDVRTRRFLFLPSDAVVQLPETSKAVWRGTAMGECGVGHLFEIVKAPT